MLNKEFLSRSLKSKILVNFFFLLFSIQNTRFILTDEQKQQGLMLRTAITL